MISLKNEREIEAMRQAGRIARLVLDEVSAFIAPGLTTKQIDDYAGSRIRAHGARSAFLGYKKYPCHVCISVNEEVVHGLAGGRRVVGWGRPTPAGRGGFFKVVMAVDAT